MEEYPEELRTPPVSLVGLVGCSELHAIISAHLNAEQPPIHTLALPDFSKISLLAKSPPKQTPPAALDPSSSIGILKRDWLLKHRTRVPAVLAAFFSMRHVSGDPAQWLEVSSQLDTLKAVTRGRNIKMVLVIVDSTSNDDLSEDRIVALRKRAEVDSKYIIFFANEDTEQKKSLYSLGSTFAELAYTYYKEEGRRVKTRIERKGFSSIDLHARYCFKVAVYAEFRRDWAEALRFYQDAYHVLGEIVGATKPTVIQRLIEIKTVAEQLHFKISTLLLHGGKIIEAITWFHKHNASYKRLVGPPQVIFLHWEWMSRQFLAFGELLETSAATVENPTTSATTQTEWEFHPAYFYQLAAYYLKEKKSCLELALSMTETINEVASAADSVIPSVFVGQYARFLEQGDQFSMQSLSEEEYINFALAEGKRFLDSFEIIDLLKRSFESYSILKAQRMASYCGFQMAKEYFSVGDFSNSKQLFDHVTSLYRQEGWVTMMWEVLGYLRECSRQQGLLKDFVEYSLEMAALPVSSSGSGQSFNSKDCTPAGPASLSQRESIHKEVFGLVKGDLELESNKGSMNLKVAGDCPLHLEIDLVSPLRAVILASVAFHDQMVKPGIPTFITVSLLSQLPQTVEIDELEIQFNQKNCNFTIRNAQRPQLVETSGNQQGYRVEGFPALALLNNKWLRMTYEITSEQVGKLECLSVIAKIGPYLTVCCRAESPASMHGLPLWKFEDRVENFPTKDPTLAFSGQKAIQVEEPDPQVDLTLSANGPALVGEIFAVPITVVSKGHAVHSGELKINLVDSSGGVLSPRDLELLCVDNQVELLGISELQDEDGSEKGSIGIRKIQQSFGLISLPLLKNDESWSCQLEIRFQRPKSIMLYVSLGYSPYGKESSDHKVHIHKSLQIEGKTAVLIRHHFMLPFRRDALLLSRLRAAPNSGQSPSLPLNETSLVSVSAKNCTEVPLELLSISIDFDGNGTQRCFKVQQGNEKLLDPALLPPGEEFKRIFSILPEPNISVLNLGIVNLRWRRHLVSEQKLISFTAGPDVLTTHRLPDANVELPPLVVSLDCPPHAILGDPFTYHVKIQNQTELLQEINFSMADSQNFVLSGSHNDTIFILPKSENVLNYKLVPLASGSLSLPRVTVKSSRFSVGFIPSAAASTVFVFPSKRHFQMADSGLEGLSSES